MLGPGIIDAGGLKCSEMRGLIKMSFRRVNHNSHSDLAPCLKFQWDVVGCSRRK